MRDVDITGVILAGGRSSRMGQDKGLILIKGIPLFEHIAVRLAPQVSKIIVNTNQHPELYGQKYPIITDLTQNFCGPLAGMLAALKNSDTDWVVFAPCDVPNLPDDLVYKLWQEKETSQATFVDDGNRVHPTLCLLNRSLITSLEEYLASGNRKLMLFLEQQNAKAVLFEDPQRFINLNTPEDIIQWQKTLGQTS